MGQMARVYRDYMRISEECALVTATDGRYAPYLFNAMASIHERFPEHPTLYVFDLGMTRLQRRELAQVPWVRLQTMDRFVTHWRLNWSWKPYILTRIPQRYVFYFDAGNIVLYRPLMLWFNTIARNGYFLIDNGQKMWQITPPNIGSFSGAMRRYYRMRQHSVPDSWASIATDLPAGQSTKFWRGRFKAGLWDDRRGKPDPPMTEA